MLRLNLQQDTFLLLTEKTLLGLLRGISLSGILSQLSCFNDNPFIIFFNKLTASN
jgi:hypothetical protein